MRRITITLTDEEYVDLEARAQAERRSPAQQAAYLVTRPPLMLQQTTPMITRPWNPIWPPNVWCGTTTTPPQNGTILGNNPNSLTISGTSLLAIDG